MQNKKSKRDWQVYGLCCKDEEILFLEKVKKTVWNMDAPWKPKTGGRRAFPTKAKVMCAMLKVKFGFDYRSMESHLRSRPDLLEIMELQKAPITQPEENAKSPVQLNDIAYWPTGKAICLFYQYLGK